MAFPFFISCVNPWFLSSLPIESLTILAVIVTESEPDAFAAFIAPDSNCFKVPAGPLTADIPTPSSDPTFEKFTAAVAPFFSSPPTKLPAVPAALAGVFPDHLLIRSDVHAIDLVLGDKILDPSN